MAPNRWLEQYTLRSQAIQNAYADLNADVAAGRLTCPAKVDRTDVPAAAAASTPNCPFNPLVSTSAFASRTFSGNPVEFFGEPTMNANHLLFPPSANVTSPTWFNMQSYSYHSYGKEGYDLAKGTSALITSVNTGYDGAARPIYTTEHASKTASSWNLADSSSDDYYEASRLASQLVWMASYGFEQYIFKFSSTPSNNGGIIKSGLHWGENEVRQLRMRQQEPRTPCVL
jgi:hypothetical protein